jgi:hypothetical protein
MCEQYSYWNIFRYKMEEAILVSTETTTIGVSNDSSPVWDEDDMWAWDISESEIEHVMESIRPLDLILFSGNTILSKTIKMVERKKYGIGNVSHIGMVIDKLVLPHIKQINDYKMYIWESTSSKCAITGKHKLKDIFNKSRFGVQIRDLEQVVTCYINSGGRVFWGKLKNNPTKIRENETEREYQDRIEILNTKFKMIYDVFGKSSYNLSLIDLGASVYGWMRPLRKLKNYIQRKRKNKPCPLFCSEFIAIIYKEIGVIDDNVEPQNIVPVDFLGVTEKGIPLILKKIVEICIARTGSVDLSKQL